MLQNTTLLHPRLRHPLYRVLILDTFLLVTTETVHVSFLSPDILHHYLLPHTRVVEHFILLLRTLLLIAVRRYLTAVRRYLTAVRRYLTAVRRYCLRFAAILLQFAAIFLRFAATLLRFAVPFSVIL